MKKERRKRSPIWEISRNELEKIVASSRTYTEVLGHFGFTTSNLSTLKRRLQYEKLSIDHFDPFTVRNTKLIQYGKSRIVPWDMILVKNSQYHISTRRKKKLVEDGYLKYECSIDTCPMKKFEMGMVWEGKPVILILDHINGNNRDNRIENLRLVCPWCNSFLDTHCGKNAKKEVNRCKVCQKPISRRASHCGRHARARPSKIDWPPIEELLSQVNSTSLTTVGKKLGTVANNVKKYIRRSYDLSWKSSYKPVPPKRTKAL